VVDSEDSIDWATKFPQNKFSSLHSISWKDASISLKIVLEALKLLSEAYDQPVLFYTITTGIKPHLLFRKSFDIDPILADSP
jgi:hypothetical protein